MIRSLILFIIGFGLGVWLEYLNVLFWKKYAKDKEKGMYATINFRVKDREEFEKLKAASRLPDEEWELIE